MKKYLKIVMIPMAIAAALILVISGFATIYFMIKIAWNLLFHEVTKEMLIKLGYAVMLFVISAGLFGVYEKFKTKE